VVIIEHDMDIVFRYSERIVVMHQSILDGTLMQSARMMRSRRRSSEPTDR
jgi:ABC-type branched-subunit amino acid transport system ATPase component